ncbi:hypothetical protein BMAPRL20_A1737 [Burkholderia mallei PRL-20]|nr:hypothetical protein BUH_2686 [Burkholderia pseudomallei Pakistan 9]EEP87650.1 conserved hypothetical protein [Burkholderia mallei GB8 horse 4]EES44636.1 hypothetical protein BMAPRL20_A1737 [Burkholderia mallei PRL-20]
MSTPARAALLGAARRGAGTAGRGRRASRAARRICTAGRRASRRIAARAGRPVRTSADGEGKGGDRASIAE